MISIMDKLNLVVQKLQQENYDPIIKSDSPEESAWKIITWTDEKGDECRIFEEDIAIKDGSLAWFQSSKHDNFLVKIYENDSSFSWEAVTYNPFFGCYCILLEWYKDHLIFIYQEKHDIYICAIKNHHVNYFNYHGEDIERNGNVIAYDTYTGKNPEIVRLIQIPELIELAPITAAEAEERGLIPTGLNRPGNFLGLK
ncbi:hypothetical protein ACE38W_06840 [Chitinophaga sp. Hz27]|uniref:hypothetical protein n=1 Tax=Chitinophaga sp. Hz27 TaxID=3347169 RepID=UPI0035D9060F